MKNLRTFNILKVFRNTYNTVPAYRDFLRKNKISPGKIKKLGDFSSLPVMDKKSYIYSYNLNELFPHGKIPPMAYASSGSSGKPTFWFRNDTHEKIGADIHGDIFTKIFNIKKNDSTLVVVCFAMGIWVAGNYTLAACRELARKGYNITVVTPSVEKSDIFSSLSTLAPNYKRLIIAGYPPFVMDVIVEALKKGIKLPEDVRIITAGDKFSETWRNTMLKNINSKDPNHSIISIYGSADAAVMGHETPLSIFIRREAELNKELAMELFGKTSDLPALSQYHPDKIFFEAINDELVLTVNTAAPLIRYSIHDRGEIMEFDKMLKIIKRHGLWKKAKVFAPKWKMPFIILKGRTDVAVTFYAINIFPEHIESALNDKSIKKHLSGSYFAFNHDKQKGKRQYLNIVLELDSKIRPANKILNLAKNAITDALIKKNIEYRKLRSTIGERAGLNVQLVSYGEIGTAVKKRKGLFYLKNKKAKLI